jgi:hypothetical protein
MASQFRTNNYIVPDFVFDASPMKSIDGKRKKRRSPEEVFNEKMTALMLLTVHMFRDAVGCFDNGEAAPAEEGVKKKAASALTWRELMAFFDIKHDFETLIRIIDYLKDEKEKREDAMGSKKKKLSPPTNNVEMEKENGENEDGKSEEDGSGSDAEEGMGELGMGQFDDITNNNSQPLIPIDMPIDLSK